MDKLDQQEAKTILLKAFSVLTDEQVSNFEYHLKLETPVLVGLWQFQLGGVG